jgi:pyruvate formate lyase activating enzyme
VGKSPTPTQPNGGITAVLIGGLERFTLSDFPGRAAAIVFTQGCNFRCPFCHNGQLLPMRPPAASALVPESEVLAFLAKRRGRLDGVVITGGEPTLQPDLADFLRALRALGFATKLDTNGSQPDIVRELLENGLLDYVAVDLKAPIDRYAMLAGVRVDLASIRTSIALVAASGVPHEFRTTVVPRLLSPDDVKAIRALVPPGSPHRLQAFRPEHALDPSLRKASVPVTAP